MTESDKQIKRYGERCEGTGANMHSVFGRNDNGDYVHYEDHKRIIDSQEKELEEARKLAELWCPRPLPW